MNAIALHIMIIAACTSIACTLVGSFLMLRGVALMSDAISHAVLPGIVIMFLLINDLSSPLLIVGASLAGIATVLIIETIIKTKRLKQDAAIGFVFPLFFSIGVLLISLYARSVHLDTDMVILGELAFAPFNRLIIGGIDCGPWALWSTGCMVLINALFISIFFKELTLTTFDPTLAHIFYVYPSLIYYLLIMVTSITAVCSFNVVGAIVVVTLMLTPPATAYLLTHRLSSLIVLSCAIGIFNSIGGYLFSALADVSIAGALAMMNGLVFLVILIVAPAKGIITRMRTRYTMNKEQAVIIVCAYLEGNPNTSSTTMSHDLNWTPAYTAGIIKEASDLMLIIQHQNLIRLCPEAKVWYRKRINV